MTMNARREKARGGIKYADRLCNEKSPLTLLTQKAKEILRMELEAAFSTHKK